MKKREVELEDALLLLLNCIVADSVGEGEFPTYRCEGFIHEAVLNAERLLESGD